MATRYTVEGRQHTHYEAFLPDRLDREFRAGGVKHAHVEVLGGEELLVTREEYLRYCLELVTVIERDPVPGFFRGLHKTLRHGNFQIFLSHGPGAKGQEQENYTFDSRPFH
jgi:hypothetical protein